MEGKDGQGSDKVSTLSGGQAAKCMLYLDINNGLDRYRENDAEDKRE